MDPISIMTAAAAAFGSSALGEVAKKSVGEAWDGVKKAVQRALGSSSAVPALMEELQADPAGREAQLAVTRLTDVQLTGYPEVVTALGRLAETLAQNGIRIGTANVGTTVYIEKLQGGVAVAHGVTHISNTFSGDK
jgi:hypothetical protein